MCTSNIAPTLFLYMRLQCTWNAFNGCVNVEGKYRSCHYACQAPLLNVYRICENARVRREFCLIYIHERIWFSQFVSVMHLLVFNYTNLDCIYSWPRPIRSVSRRQFLSSFFSDVLCGNGICTCALFRSCWLHRGGTGPLRVMGQVHFGSRVAARQLDIQTRRHALQQLYCTHNSSGHNAFDSVARMRTVFVRDVDGPIICIWWCRPTGAQLNAFFVYAQLPGLDDVSNACVAFTFKTFFGRFDLTLDAPMRVHFDMGTVFRYPRFRMVTFLNVH